MRAFFTTLILFLFLFLGAQEYTFEDRATSKDLPVREEILTPAVIARLNFIMPSFILEFAPAEHFSFSAGIWIWPRFWEKNSSTGENYFHPTVSPTISLEPRFFINQAYRTTRGKRTDYYSGWYVGIPFRMEFPEFRFTMGTTIGFQCTFGRRWFWTAGAGPGAYYREGNFKIRPMVDTGFGLILN